MTKGHLWKPPLAEDLTSPRAGRALCPHSAAAEAWDVAMRHSDAKSRRVSGALRQRALPIMDTATAVETGFQRCPHVCWQNGWVLRRNARSPRHKFRSWPDRSQVFTH